LAGKFLPNVFRMAAPAGVCALQSHSVFGQERPGITHAPLLKSELPNTPGQEVIVWDTQYAPGAVNPRHLHPAAITFHVLSGTGVWQEDGKPPVTLHAGDSLFVPAGTIHTHWNPSTAEPLRFLEFIVADKDKGRSIPQPPKN
jgi:quercetin dioxygenase-like cupin family protein